MNRLNEKEGEGRGVFSRIEAAVRPGRNASLPQEGGRKTGAHVQKGHADQNDRVGYAAKAVGPKFSKSDFVDLRALHGIPGY